MLYPIFCYNINVLAYEEFMKKIYFIDSENVGETWIDALDKINGRFIIFYTKNSPRISYHEVIQLMNANNKPEFIECYEGNNGLDFQLVSYLGCDLRADQTKEMIIVSNDTGFDAVVHFWLDRGMNVKRVSRSDLVQSKPDKLDMLVSDDGSFAEFSSVEEFVGLNDDAKNHIIINCIGAKQLAHIYTALTRIYGEKKGRKQYNALKKAKFPAPDFKWDKSTRIQKIIELLLYHGNIKNPDKERLIPFLINNVVNNNQSMLSKFKNEFGNRGEKLHNLFKDYYKLLIFLKN